MMKLRQIFFCAVTIVVIAACSKSGGETDDGGGGPHVVTPTDTTAPEISIFTPTVNQVFTNGSIINITGRITDDFGLYRGTIRVVNDANGTVLLNQAYEIHGLLLYNFNINHTASVGTATDYTVTVTFEDHGSNSATKSVKVKVNP
jgi:DNA/RNA endonuclease YhcR with UshA esterase domain